MLYGFDAFPGNLSETSNLVISGPVSAGAEATLDADLLQAARADERALRWRKHAQSMQAFITASFCIDAACMGLLAMVGAIGAQVPLLYLLFFGAGTMGFTAALLRRPNQRFPDPYLTMPQMLVASSIQFAFMLWAPAIGVPLLTGLFIVVGFAGLRLNLTQAGLASLWLTFGVSVVLGLRGHELAIPLDTPVQRLISGLWISSIVARAIMLGQYGAQLRKTLVQRNEALNVTMKTAAQLASRDGLTGALNRASILKAINVERLRLARNGQQFSVALLDLDHFKRINDGFGHLVGDQVLTLVVAQITAELRAGDSLGRYGGEEFLLLLGDAGGEPEARQVVERILRAVQRHDWPRTAAGLQVTTSAGLAVARAGESVNQLLNRADNALYRAKNDGRNRVCVG